MAWRYIAQRISGPMKGTFLDWNVPLRDVKITKGVGTDWMSATIAPQINLGLGPDGFPVLDKWSTAIWAEQDGEIRGGGILVEGKFVGPERSLECMGYSGYPTGIPFEGDLALINYSPMAAASTLWDAIQVHSNSNLELIVIQENTSPVKLGVSGIPAIQQVLINGGWHNRSDIDPSQVTNSCSMPLSGSMTNVQTEASMTAIGNFARLTLPYYIRIGAETLRANTRPNNTFTSVTRGQSGTAATSHTKGTLVKYTGTPVRTIPAVPAEPWKLSWWEATDIGSTLDTLMKDTPFGMKEQHYWDPDVPGTIKHELKLRYPAFGTRRTDLRFMLGENIEKMPDVDDFGMHFANSSVGLGSGTGRSIVRTSMSIPDHRLRRVHVFIDNTAKTVASLNPKVSKELIKRARTLSLSNITIIEHPNAEINSINAGDEILVQADIGWMKISQWCKVVTIDVEPELSDKAQLTLEGLSS